jgi:ribonuclease HI/exonuclease III
MNGKAAIVDGVRKSKWEDIENMMKTRRMGIIALQETHLDDASFDNLQNLHQRRLVIINSPDPERPSQSAGVAFAINKDIVSTDNITVEEIIPGRALLLDITWRDGQRLLLLNVYAPNDKASQVAFWDKLHDLWGGGRARKKPDLMLGDFNAVEDPIDRAPARRDDNKVVDSMREARIAMGLVDAWRHAHASIRRFTYSSCRRSLSRIDRICAKTKHIEYMFGWDTSSPPVRTDHRMVAFSFAPEDSPEVGKGRWTWPKSLLQNKVLTREVERRAEQLELDVEEWKHNREAGRDTNPQTIWRAFKIAITERAKALAKVDLNRIKRRILTLQTAVSAKENEPAIDESQEIREEAASMREEYEQLLRKERKDRGAVEKGNWMAKGEIVAPYWMNINKEHKPRDMILRLRVPGSEPPVYARTSKSMTELMRAQYDGIQRPPEDNDHTVRGRRTHIDTVLSTIPDSQKMDAADGDLLAQPLTAKIVAKALKSMPGGRASGIDGIPYEVWKGLHHRWEQAQKSRGDDMPPNIIGVMTTVFNDIQSHGLDERTEFNLGWICPLYKKKDKAEPANYRPITLLNSDYKIMTKALTMRLVDFAHQMIHKDQAGFVPGRLIFDHVRLSKAMINYAEAYEENGLIVALDQEKAYDRIRHDYLWDTMKSFNIPDSFINTVRHLYTGAKSTVVVNGFSSEPFAVTRGVRQGDPLSCLLFDLAIEPLACSLRSDPRLTGYKIPGVRSKVLVNLFADDTLIYLNARDKYSDLLDVLRRWCAASGAKFNEGKTEIVPIGTPEFRAGVEEHRCLSDGDTHFAESVTVTPDGHTVRSLGARIGNDGDDMEPWSVVLDKIQADLDRWQRGNPTLDGKRHIVQMVVGGRTQYLTKVQGMPKAVEDKLERMTKEFIWPENRSSPIALKQLYRPKEEGGLGLMDIRARNLAIEGTWLRSFVDTSPARPSWAFVTDSLLRCAEPDIAAHLRASSMYFQKWKVPKQGKKYDALPPDVKSMLRAAQKLQVSFAAVKLSERLKLQMPAWGHIGAQRWTYYQERDECLGERHAVETIGDLIDVSQRSLRQIEGRRHLSRRDCACSECRTDRLAGCEDPSKCCRTAALILNKIGGKFSMNVPPPPDNLTLTHSRLEKNQRAITERKGLVTFDPSVTAKTSLGECVRFFVDESKLSNEPAHRLVNPVAGLNIEHLRRTVYTDGSCIDNGTPDAKCGAGIWRSVNSSANKAIRVPGPSQSNQVGEIVAVIVALQDTPPEVPITIRTDSLYVMDGVTRHLGAWEDEGWIGKKNKDHFKALAYQLRRRSAQTDFEKVKAHSNDTGNDGADALAKEGAEKDEPDDVDLSIPPAFDIQGVKSTAATQRVLNRGIIERQERPVRHRMQRNLDIASQALKNGPFVPKTEEAIWKGMRSKNLRKNIGQYLFRATHGSHKIGRFWSNIPGYEDRARCSACGSANESMDHILIHCPESKERKTIWRLARTLWRNRAHPWPTLSLGLILACGALQFEIPEGEANGKKTRMRAAKCASRLLQIILSESAQLIWAIRCERVIQERTHTIEEITSRWYNKISTRFEVDRTRAIKVLRTKLSMRLMHDTWHEVVKPAASGHGSARGDWASDLRVLVGIRRPVPPRALPRGDG